VSVARLRRVGCAGTTRRRGAAATAQSPNSRISRALSIAPQWAAGEPGNHIATDPVLAAGARLGDHQRIISLSTVVLVHPMLAHQALKVKSKYR
jgi:hypothetical protein